MSRSGWVVAMLPLCALWGGVGVLLALRADHQLVAVPWPALVAGMMAFVVLGLVPRTPEGFTAWYRWMTLAGCAALIVLM